MRLMLDSSIVIDYLKMRDPFYAAARKLILLGFLSEHDLRFSSAQANDVFYTLTGGGKPALAVQLKRDLKKLRQGVRICGVNEVEFDAALDSSWSDLEGSCVHQCALKLKADAIIARNQKDFEKSSIKVFDCDELFAYLAEEKGLVYEEIPW